MRDYSITKNLVFLISWAFLCAGKFPLSTQDSDVFWLDRPTTNCDHSCNQIVGQIGLVKSKTLVNPSRPLKTLE